jgi:hypothetical protein
MKHIFLAHSPITYLVSVSIISKLEISKEDAVIIFFDFDKKENDRYISVSIYEFYENKFLKKLYNYFSHFNIVNRIDRIINLTIKNEKFTAYVPVLLLTGKALITHVNCCSFNFIEEGLLNYYKEETLAGLTAINSKDSWRSSILKDTKRALYEMYMVLRGYNFKLQALPFSYSCYNSFGNVLFYGVSSQSFPLAENTKRVIVPFDKKNFRLIKKEENINLTDKIIWIGDGGVFIHGFSETLYIKGIEKGCVDFLKKKGEKNILIKFHRDESLELRQKIKKLFQDNDISIQIIPDSVIMELLLFEAQNATLIGVYSSLLFYAAIMRHHAYSIYDFIKGEYSKVLRNRDFSFYWNKVSLIKAPDPDTVEVKPT